MEDKRDYRTYYKIGLGVTVLWLIAFLTSFLFSNSDLSEEAGTFGDSFGAVNALFSGLAFAGIVIALIIQSKEYALAQTERREGLDNQREISKIQRQATQVQAIGLRMDIEKGKGFRPGDINTDSIEFERLKREANYKFELDTIVSELFQKEPPDREVFTRRLKLAELLVEAAWALVNPAQDDSQQVVVNRLRDEISEPSLHSLLTDKFLLLNFEQDIIADQLPSRMDDVFGEYENQAYCKLTREAILVLGFCVSSDTQT